MIKNDDKEIERARYDERAKTLLSHTEDNLLNGADSVRLSLRSPYIRYEQYVKEYITRESMHVLELGAGTGAFTGVLLETGANIFATDISECSLAILNKRYSRYRNLRCEIADIESLPFANECIDIVACAGGLSYGDNELVLNEIYRVLRHNGVFLAVDSLNHNPVYRINRWLHYLRGKRTLSTLKRMPTVMLLNEVREKFGNAEIDYFGALAWLNPLLNRFLSEQKTSEVLEYTDKLFSIKKSAFKFVMRVQKVK